MKTATSDAVMDTMVKPIDQAHLFQNRDYPVLTDYRSLLGGLFQRMYGLDQTGLNRVFAAVQPRDLALI